jgi:hypothetical protein
VMRLRRSGGILFTDRDRARWYPRSISLPRA